MENPQSRTEFAAAAGISISYASEILTGKRDPSKTLAIQIYRRTGRKFGFIADASEADIDAMQRLLGIDSRQSERAA